MMENLSQDLFARLKGLRKLILKKDIYLAAIVAITLIAVGLFFGWYNNKVVPLNTNPIARYVAEPGNHLSFMANWDGPDYLNIATSGYTSVDQTNFFPLYPLLIHGLNFIISSPLDCALTISWISLVGLIYFYLKIVNILFAKRGTEALRATLLFLLFPTAVFFLAAYTESLFAFLALGSIYFTLKKKYFYAALMALPMTATHVTGVFVLVFITLIMWEQKAKLKHIVSTFITGSLGLVGYMIYLEEKYKAPLSFVTSQKSHGWLANNYAGLSSFNLLNGFFIILLVMAALYWWKKRLSFALYSLMFLLIPIVGQQFGGFNRYVLMAFPVPLMLYGIAKKRPTLYVIILALTSICWAYLLLQYAGGYTGS